jgi:hypothetical protein
LAAGQFKQWKTEEFWACEEKKNPSFLEADACCIIHWLRSYAGCSEPEHVHTWAALLIGHVPIDRLIYVEDCCLISVDAEGVSWVLHIELVLL